MNFSFTPEQEALRLEVRSFLEDELKKGTFEITPDAWLTTYSKELGLKIGQRGWLGMTWPKKYGGGERSYMDRLVVMEELLRYGAPVGNLWAADRQIGPSLLAYGTEELKSEFLPRIIRGELTFCLGMSEPEAGSDLASLQTKAIKDGDYYIINGQKLWIGLAHIADYCYLVARTNPHSTRHKGISEILVDMKLPGITVRPLMNIIGKSEFCEVFFDDVRVPKRYLVGEENRGWYQIVSQLDYERAGSERLMSNYPLFESLIQHVKKVLLDNDLSDNEKSVIKNKMAQLLIEFEIGRLLIYRVVYLLDSGRAPNYEAAMAKAFCTSFTQRVAKTAMEILGQYSQLKADSSRALLGGMAAKAYLFSPAHTVAAGTNEILKNIIATRGLQLPVARNA